jgi:hypothetical protein
MHELMHELRSLVRVVGAAFANPGASSRSILADPVRIQGGTSKPKRDLFRFFIHAASYTGPEL